ncbi:MAG: hypothetical protein ACOYOK_15540, partial [Pseudobdellovibrionaceae bacterium]
CEPVVAAICDQLHSYKNWPVLLQKAMLSSQKFKYQLVQFSKSWGLKKPSWSEKIQQHFKLNHEHLVQKLKDSPTVENSLNYRMVDENNTTLTTQLKIHFRKNDDLLFLDLNGTTDSDFLGLSESVTASLALQVLNESFFQDTVITQQHLNILQWSQPLKNFLRKKTLTSFAEYEQSVFLWKKTLSLLFRPNKKKTLHVQHVLPLKVLLQTESGPLFFTLNDDVSSPNPFDLDQGGFLVHKINKKEALLTCLQGGSVEWLSLCQTPVPKGWTVAASPEPFSKNALIEPGLKIHLQKGTLVF